MHIILLHDADEEIRQLKSEALIPRFSLDIDLTRVLTRVFCER
jgi:hypothetical protein